MSRNAKDAKWTGDWIHVCMYKGEPDVRTSDYAVALAKWSAIDDGARPAEIWGDESSWYRWTTFDRERLSILSVRIGP